MMEFIKTLNKIRETPKSVVYTSKHLLNNKFYILKEVKQDISKGGIPASTIREISLLKELDHPNIIDLHNVFIGKTTISLLFECITMDLKTYIDRLPKGFVFPQTAIQCYMYQIVDAIEFCHRRRIFHRNLASQNILINHKGTIKIIDFDAGRTFEVTQKVYTHNVSMLWYRAPEILLGSSQYTPKVDIWSIGCIFAEMFLRKPIFQGNSEINQVFKIVEVIGTPNKMTWPEMENLPYYFSGLSKNKECRLKQFVKSAKNIEIHLMKLMLKFNPRQRISAQRILDHQYFSNFNKNLRVPTIF